MKSQNVTSQQQVFLSTSIEPLTEKKWKVSSRMKNILYIVERVTEERDCKILCRECNICQHIYIYIYIYTWTCLDATLYATVSKQIHLIQMKTNSVIQNLIAA